VPDQNFFQYRRGRPAPDMGKPLASVMVVVSVLGLVDEVFINGVNCIFGGVRSRRIPPNSSAPISGAEGVDVPTGYPGFG
jgi:hypothetical protein